MTTPRSIEQKTYRNIAWAFAGVLAMTTLACGTSSQSMLGTGPSSLSAAAASAVPNTLAALKDGKGKDHPGKPDPVPPPETPITPPAATVPPTTTTPDVGDSGDGDTAGHGETQIEGIATKVTGTCPALAILVNGQTVTTALATDFQGASCAQIKEGQRLHIAGSMQLGSFVATSVRMQGQKPGDDQGDAGDDTGDGTVPPTTPGTPPPTGTTPTTSL